MKNLTEKVELSLNRILHSVPYPKTPSEASKLRRFAIQETAKEIKNNDLQNFDEDEIGSIMYKTFLIILDTFEKFLLINELDEVETTMLLSVRQDRLSYPDFIALVDAFSRKK